MKRDKKKAREVTGGARCWNRMFLYAANETTEECLMGKWKEVRVFETRDQIACAIRFSAIKAALSHNCSVISYEI